MKRIKLLLFTLLLILPFKVLASGSITVSTSKVSLYEGGTYTFKITAKNAAGRVDITSSDKGVAKVSTGSVFVDNNSAKVKITAKGIGTATITVKIITAGTYDGDELTGSKTIKVTVKKKPEAKPAEPKPTVPSEPKDIKITSFNIVGYDIPFDEKLLEYTIDVAPNVSKLYIIVKGENYTITGDKEVNIKDKDSINVVLKGEKETRTYTIKINRVANEIIKTETTEVEKKVEVVKTDKTYLYTTIGLGALCLVLVVLLLTKKKKTTDTTYNTMLEEKRITPLQTTHINSVPYDNTTSPVYATSTTVETQNQVNPNSNNIQ